MSAFVHHGSAEAEDHATPNPEWPACEQARLPGDGSMRWLGLLLLGATSLVTLRGLVWLGHAVFATL